MLVSHSYTSRTPENCMRIGKYVEHCEDSPEKYTRVLPAFQLAIYQNVEQLTTIQTPSIYVTITSYQA